MVKYIPFIHDKSNRKRRKQDQFLPLYIEEYLPMIPKPEAEPTDENDEAVVIIELI